MNTGLSILREAAGEIADAQAILITAGAGMGVDSGLPDFRGPDGFWKAYPPYKKLGLNFYDMANPETFSSDPNLAWGFYGHRLNLYRETTPHRGFSILKEWVSSKDNNYFIFTSNVDGQFQKAGFKEEKIMECHGSIHHLQCSRPCSDDIFSYKTLPEVDSGTMRADGELPKCPLCNAVARPNILMFGDPFWISERTEAQNRSLSLWLKENSGRKLVIIEMGAGTAVPTVRYFSQNISKKFNAKLIRINPREYNYADIQIPFGAKYALSGIDDLIKSSKAI